MTGASGSVVAGTAIDRILQMAIPVIATASSAARLVWQEEMDESFGAALERWDESDNFTFYPSGDLRAPIASGTFPTLGMAVVPCSMSTMAAIAHGISDNLPRRAADVCLKERRKLVIVPRETPLGTTHLENMHKLSTLGAVVLPAMPGFYHDPHTIEDQVDFVVSKLFDQFDLDFDLMRRWEG